MNIANRIVAGTVLFLSIACASSDELSSQLMDFYEKERPIPVLSVRHPHLNVTTAYRVQKAYVQKRLHNDQVAGFKAGLTSQHNQEQFNVDLPVTGVLFVSGKKPASVSIDRSMFKLLMIETEIGFIVGQPITHPLSNVAELRQKIRAVVPVVELPDLGFDDVSALKRVDIIAANVASAQFIVGKEIETGDIDPNKIVVLLLRDSEEINRGKGSDLFGDQWEAALWLINEVVQQGWDIEPGHILLTGALGKMMPGKPGNYEADFGNLGRVFFTIS